jgi:hypothetical protein
MKAMSAELKAMLDRPRADKTKPTRAKDLCDTEQQRLLMLVANRLIGKQKRPVKGDGIVQAESCGVRGLRPTWHGRAS